MPLDYYDDDEQEKDSGSARAGRTDFDCPSCNANNPVDEPLTEGAEVLCNYCGSEFKVKVSDDGRMKFREI